MYSWVVKSSCQALKPLYLKDLMDPSLGVAVPQPPVLGGPNIRAAGGGVPGGTSGPRRRSDAVDAAGILGGWAAPLGPRA